MATTYRITVLDLDDLNEVMDIEASAEPSEYAGKTYPGFTLIEEGSMSGAYFGVINEEDVIFYGDELKSIEEEI